MKRLLQDGLLLAVAERATLRGLLGAKALGIGGAAIGLALAAPPLIRKLREVSASRLNREAGALQGAPISPLLSNAHLHPFDVEMTRRGLRLIRYCDDFVRHEARTEHDARASAARRRAASLSP